MVEHRNTYSGTFVYCPTAGANSATLLVFDLDAKDPAAWEWLEDGGREKVGKSPFFEQNNVTLANGEVHDFLIVGTASKYLCRWMIHLDLEIGDRQKTVIVGDDPDDPLMTSGQPDAGFQERLDWAWYAGRRFLPQPVPPIAGV